MNVEMIACTHLSKSNRYPLDQTRNFGCDINRDVEIRAIFYKLIDEESVGDFISNLFC